MSNTAIRVVPAPAPEVAALVKVCQEMADTSALDRFEIAVKSRTEAGIKDDNELRIADELLHQVVLASDDLETATKPAISAAHALHKTLIATAAPWKKRWDALQSSLNTLMLDYKRRQRELAARQQRELEQAADAERRRKEQEARLALRNGDVTGAKVAMQQAAQVVTPIIARATPVLENTKDRQVWNAGITDPMALVKAIADGTVPLAAIKEWNMTFLKQEAATRGGLSWPGVETWQEDRQSVRR